jgi:hypothetical protein
MPAVALTKEQKLNKRIADLTEDTRTALYKKRISIKSVADVAGVSGPAVSAQFKRGQMTLSVYLAAQMLLEEK